MKQFIEIGSNCFDTCLQLAKNGWKGVMIEAVPKIFAKMKKQNEDYPINSLNLAITDYDGEIEFAVPKLAEDEAAVDNLIFEEWMTGVGHVISKDHKGMNGIGLMESPEGKNILHEKIKVKCKKLDTLIEDLGIDKVDYLKVDTEGHELNVLEAYSWDVLPTMMKIEHRHLSEDAKDKLKDLFKGKGYVVHNERFDFYCFR